MKDYKIFVISIDQERQKKYTDARYNIFEGVNGKDLDIDFINENYNFYWNAFESTRKNIAGCSQSHIKCMEHIRDNKINNAIIIEDDALIDFNRLEELDNVEGFCFIGGRFIDHKNVNKKIETDKLREILVPGLNIIDTSMFNIMNAHGYYISNFEIIDELIKKELTKRRAIDVEFKHKQRKKIITQFIYPAISILYLPDANTGFTYTQSNYKLDDNLYRY